jgi:hypothetical protein
MGDKLKFPVRSVLKNMQVGDTIEFPCGRNTETHLLFGDRRGSIRTTATKLKKHEGLRFSVKAESKRTIVTRLGDDPNFGSLHKLDPSTESFGDSIRGRIMAMKPGDEIMLPKNKEKYLRSLTSQLFRTKQCRYAVNSQPGRGAYVFVTCLSVPQKIEYDTSYIDIDIFE